jgi:hypothetical protein
MKLLTIIEQIVFNTYEGMVRVMYKEGESENIAELLRALPGITTVTNAGSSSEMGAMTFKSNATSKYPNIIKIEIANETIEEK